MTMKDLAMCASEGDAAGVKYWLDLGVNPNARGGSRLTPLMWAARSGQAECCALMLPRADPHVADLDGCDALMHAAAGGHIRAVELLAPLSDLKQRSNSGRGALHYAVNTGEAECVRFLAMDPRCDILQPDAFGRTPAMIARAAGREPLAILLEAILSAREEAAALGAEIAQAPASGHVPRL